MAYDFTKFKTAVSEVENWFSGELSGIRTGRASAVLLDGVVVDSYGTKTALKHVANISVEDARSLRIAPWDNGLIKGIETAIAAANLGVSTMSDSAGIRVIFPELTSDRRVQLVKLLGQKLEDARVSLRKEREAVWNDIQKQEKDGTLSEDDKFKGKESLQKIVDEGNAKLEALAAKKEQEIAG